MVEPSWEERIKTLATPGKIRLFTKPDDVSIPYLKFWYSDLSLTDWITNLNNIREETSTITQSLQPPDFLERVTEIFERNQRMRFLACVVLQRWKQRVWKKRTICNIDMIDMEEVSNRDAILITDTSQHQIFRFHRRDIYNNLIANICMSEQMMPYPRVPTNPWTNIPWTLAQTISVCSQISLDYATRGKCPPVLLAAFCASRYNLYTFKRDYASMLSHHAISDFFKDLTIENMDTVYDTIVQLLAYANLRFSPSAISRWLSQKPQTALHKEWLLLVHDYTIYINLHVQLRSSWKSSSDIRHDIRNLYHRTTIDIPSPTPTPTPTTDFLEGIDPHTALLLISATLFR